MLQINYSQGIFEIEGKLAAENVKSLKHHVETLLNAGKDVILSLDKLEKIDASGINVISNLYKKAIRNNKIFYVIGRDNKKIAKALKRPKLRYIVRRDIL